MTSSEIMTGPHWTFSLAIYGTPGVAPACVLLQDRCGVDVNVLLLALYANARLGLVIGQSRIQTLDLSIAALRAQVVVPLRQIRRHMKTTGYGAATEQVRNNVKIAELTAEQLEQAVLAALLATWPANRAEPSPAKTVVEQVVLYYAAGPLDDDIQAAIATIARVASAAR